jgi:type II secretory pathway pseudopilin PulG
MRNPIAEFKKKRMSDEDGYTAFEILGGLVLLGILFTFILSQFLGWRETTQDKNAQNNLRTAQVAVKGPFTLDANYDQTFATLAAAGLAGCDQELADRVLECVEPEIEWVEGDMANLNKGQVNAQITEYEVVFGTVSESSRWYCTLIISDDEGPAYAQMGNQIGVFWAGGAKTTAACPAIDAGLTAWRTAP